MRAEPATAAGRDLRARACPCRHGDRAAELAWQRPLLERAVAGDAAAVAELYDGQVEAVYRYLLAWTGDRQAAMALTGQVFAGALAWLEVIAAGDGELGVWLIAAARDAVVQRRGTGWVSGPRRDRTAAPVDALAAVALLGDPEREVVVLRLLLGHSLLHTAKLSGYSPRAVKELQLAACLGLWELTGGARSGQRPQLGARADERLAEELDRRLARWAVDLSGDDPELADALAVASSLRLAAPRQVTAPDHAFVERLRGQLLAAAAERRAAGDAAAGLLDRAGQRLGALRGGVARRPWVASGVAALAIAGILTVQALGRPDPARCAGVACLPATSAPGTQAAVVPAPASKVPKVTATSTSVLAAQPSTSAPPRPTASSAPPTTLPATTAPPTTRPRPTTTTVRETTTTVGPTSTTTGGTTTTSLG